MRIVIIFIKKMRLLTLTFLTFIVILTHLHR